MITLEILLFICGGKMAQGLFGLLLDCFDIEESSELLLYCDIKSTEIRQAMPKGNRDLSVRLFGSECFSIQESSDDASVL
jgi:hypothetical protein